MLIAGYEYRGEKPFSNVYLTGIVRDKQGRKMSKSLGNSPDPIELIDKYGADGVRVGMLLCSPAGNDLPFDESYCEQGRNFSNKIWNAFRLVKMWEVDEKLQQSEGNKIAIDWFSAKFSEQLEAINEQYLKYRMSEALMTSYKLVWDDFCAWYLEMIKPEYVDGKSNPIDKKTYDSTINFFEKILQLLHPFIPFLTEELWHLTKERNKNESIMISKWPASESNINQHVLSKMEISIEAISQIRNFRNSKNISPKEKQQLFIKGNLDTLFPTIIGKLANLSSFEPTASKTDNAFSFLIKDLEFFIPMGIAINVAEEVERLSKELEYNKGFLLSVQKKLANERFVQNAKAEVIDMEKKKQADAEAKIKAIEEQLASIK